MRTGLGARERAWLWGSAFAALVGAHALTFFLAAPDHHDRAELLHETGHGSWTSIFILAGAAFVAAIVALGNRWASPRDRAIPLPRLIRFAWKRLVPLQVAGFIALECTERAFAHGSPLEAISEPLVLWGLALQVLAALACGLLLAVFTRLVRRLRASGVRHEPAAAAAEFTAPTDVIVPRSVSRRAWSPRGPPLLPRSC
jgi:hypothetical protein